MKSSWMSRVCWEGFCLQDAWDAIRMGKFKVYWGRDNVGETGIWALYYNGPQLAINLWVVAFAWET